MPKPPAPEKQDNPNEYVTCDVCWVRRKRPDPCACPAIYEEMDRINENIASLGGA